MRNIIFTIIICGLSFFSFSQKTGISYKWGELSDIEKNMSQCEFDTDAKAVILFNRAIMNFGAKDGFRTYVHKRIKIFDIEAAEALSFVSHYLITHEYDDDHILYGAKEIRAQSINFNENGEEIITELDKDDIYIVDNQEYFTIPNVKAGSIIEYSYVTQNWSLKDNEWYFQEEYPTLESSFELFTGKHKMNIVPILVGNQLIKKYKDQDINKWCLYNVPATLNEKYAAPKEDYAEHIILKPSGYYKARKEVGDFNNIIYQYVFVDYESTWEEIVENQLDDPDYKSYLSHHKTYEALLENVISDDDSDTCKMIKIYDFVRQNYVWNGTTRYWIKKENKFNTFQEKRSGSSSEINLFLCQLLKEANLEAYTALTRTRNKGKIIDHIPLRSQFNQLLAYVKINGKDHFLNATDTYRPYYMLNSNDYNGLALIMDKEDAHWQSMPEPLEYKTTTQISINLNIDSSHYHIKVKSENKAALDEIKRFKNKAIDVALDEEIKSLFANFENIQLLNFKYSDLELNREPFIYEYDVTVPMNTKEDMGFIILNSHDLFGGEENPFPQQNRTLPVDFASPQYNKIILNITAEPSLKVQNEEQSLRLLLSNNGGFYTASMVKNSDHQIMLISTLKLKNDFYHLDEYKSLRDLFIQMIDFEEQDVIFEQN